MNKRKTILVIAVSGIGNTVMATPLIRQLSRTNWTIEVLSLNQTIASPLLKSPWVSKFYFFGANFFQTFKLLLCLRARRYDYSLVIYPSNNWRYNILCFVVGAKQRLIHSYPKFKYRNWEFLQNLKTPALAGIHDIEQNLNLLALLSLPKPENNCLAFFTDEKDQQSAQNWLKNNVKGPGPLVGVHLGAGARQNSGQKQEKRWPLANFAALLKLLRKSFACEFVVLVGPQEQSLQKAFRELADSDKIHFFTGSLGIGAELIAHCRLFLSNDSGPMHIAAAKNIPTVGIFGPTDETRTAPRGEKCLVARNQKLACRPCLQYPINTTKSRIACGYNFDCLKKLSPEEVFNAIKNNSLLK